MEDYSKIVCEIHNKQITIVCTRYDCNQTRSCCEECKKEHQRHIDDLYDLNQQKNQNEQQDKKFEEIQNKINTQLKQIQSGLESILKIQPTNIKNSAEIDVQVLYSIELKKFIENFKNTLTPIISALIEATKILKDTTIKMKHAFESSYKQNQNRDKQIYKDAFENKIIKMNSIIQSFIIEKQEFNQISQENLIVQQEKEEIDIKSNDQEQILQQSQNQQKINQEESKNKMNLSQLPISQFQLSDIRFSLKDKSDKITLSQDQMQAEGNQFVLCENFKGNEQITKFAFQVVSGEFIFVGACHKEIIYQNKYEASFKKEIIGHGAYLITNYGKAFSHKELKYNGGTLQLKFSDSDIVVVEIDRSSNRIKWKVYDEKDTEKLDQNRRFSMQFDPKVDICPCVYLLYNSQVKIYKQQN